MNAKNLIKRWNWEIIIVITFNDFDLILPNRLNNIAITEKMNYRVRELFTKNTIWESYLLILNKSHSDMFSWFENDTRWNGQGR